MKQNDWIVATINNPEYTADDFRDLAGLTLDNTLFLSREDYLKSDFIKNNKLFKDKDGNFNEEKFNYIYNIAAKNFINFTSEDEINNFQYSIWDVTRPSNASVKNENFTINRVDNPDQITMGVSGLLTITEPTRSRRSLALDSKIYDPKSGKYLDKSVNDISLFSNPIEYIKSLFGEPLVYATYDEDTIEIDPSTGREIKHSKGEWKTNEYGHYYTEKLNGRDILGKTVVSASDYVTSEHSALLKYDFFDADDLDKSTMGTIVNNIVTLLPLFTPISPYYAGFIVSRELAKSLSMMYGIITGLSSNERPNDKLLNTISAYGLKFSGSVSDHSLENTFTSENIFNMIGDVVSQFHQLKFIANSFNKLVSGNKAMLNSAEFKAVEEYNKRALKYFQDTFLGKITPSQFRLAVGIDVGNIKMLKEVIKTGAWRNTPVGERAINKHISKIAKTMENRGKMGSNLALSYMAIVSNADVYDSILEKGGTPFEAAAIALGSTIGMFTLDKYLGLGELFYEDDLSRRALRQTAKEMVESYVPKLTTDTTTLTLLNNMKQGIKLGQKIIDNYKYRAKNRDLGILGKAIGEALEETGEELITDFSKQLGEIAGLIGYFSQTDYGAWDNAFDRYVMSFLGGMAGGTIYGTLYAILNRGRKALEFQNDVTYLLRLGRKQELLKEINKVFDRGYGGSKNIAFEKGPNGEILTADNGRESESEHNRKQLINLIEQLDFILNENLLNLSEDELFDKMIQGDFRANALNDWLKGSDIIHAKNMSYISRFLEDFNNLLNDIVKKLQEIDDLNGKTSDGSKSSEDYKNKLSKLQTELQQLLELKEYLFGEGSLGYVEKTLFAMDPALALRFGFLNYNQYVRQIFGVDASLLTLSELESANKAWEDYSKHQIKLDVDIAFRIYKEMEKSIAPGIESLKKQNLEKQIKIIEDLKKNFPFNKWLKPKDLLPGLSDKEYLDIITKKDNEDEETYNARLKKHQEDIDAYNEEHLYKWISDYLNNAITTSDLRYIASVLPYIRSQYLDHKAKLIKIEDSRLQNAVRDLVRIHGSENVKALYESTKKEISKIVTEDIRNNVEKTDTLVIDNDGYYTIISFINDYIDSLSEDIKSELLLPDSIDGLEGISPELFELYVRHLILTNEGKTDEQKSLNVNNFLSDYGITLSEKGTFGAIMSESMYELIINNTINDIYNSIKENVLDPIVELLNDSDLYQSILKLVNANFVKNPALEIVNIISKNSPNKGINLEQFLTDIYTTYNNGQSALDFQLSSSLIEILNQFLLDLKVAQSYLYAASTDSNLSSPVGHNKAINDFINKHKDVFSKADPLPELESNIANFLINELDNYSREIESWIERHNINTLNRDSKLLNIESAITKTILDFFKINRDAFKIDDFDLLDGFEGIDLDKGLSSVLALEEILYNNYNKFIGNGNNLNKFLDTILPKVINLNRISDLKVSKLDENLDYGTLSDYDKFLIIISSIATSSRDYYVGLYKFLNDNINIAPIAPQEYVSKLVYAQLQNPKLINLALDYISKKTGEKLQVVHNTSIVVGVGGSGKTFAVAGLNLGQGENVWVSGPEQDLINNLLNSLPKSKAVTKTELLNLIFGGKVPNLSTLYTTSKNEAGITIIKLKDNLSLATIKEKPKAIVIDEATHFSTPEVAIISEFCTKNDINLFLIGDEHLNGFDEGRIHNILSDLFLSWRAPALSISLRSNNVVKTANQNPLLHIIDLIIDIPMNNIGPVAERIYDEYIKNLELVYNDDNNLVGELITSQLTPEILSKIPKDKNVKIGFIGEDSSNAYKELVRAGYNPIIKNLKQVQGQEFDYVIIDLKWQLDVDSNNWSNSAIKITNFIKNLYTLISRSRNGSIIIDNGLSNIVNNRQVKYSGVASTIEQSVKRFRESRLPLIEKAITDTKKYLTKLTENRREFTLSNGNKITGILREKEGITEITLLNDPTFKPEDFNLTSEDITGDRSQFESDEDYNKAIEKVSKGFKVDKLLVDSDNTVSIVIGDKTIKTLNTLDNLFKPLSKPDVDTLTVLGAKVDKSDLEEEKEEKLDNSNYNNEEIKKSLDDDDNFSIDSDYSITAFSNLSYSGIDTSQEVWQNEEDFTSDLGIFIRPGTKVKPGDKKKYIYKVLTMKNIFEYGVDYWERLDPDIRKRFPKSSFEDAIKNNQFYILISDENSSNNRLIGLTEGTGLSNDARATYKNKIIKVVVKLADSEGRFWTLSLGGLNNPDTWESNKDVIIKGILEDIDRGAENSKELKKYILKLPRIIEQYRLRLDLIIKDGKEILIEAPKFSLNTRLYKLDNSYRLENMNDSYSPYNNKSPFLVTSDIYINLSELNKISPKIKGKAVMFVSHNLLLSSSELKNIYLEQLENPEMPKQVRMLVLDNLGVSFLSLFTKKYKDIYKKSKGDTIFTVPFEIAPMAVRMYISMWNFRAGLNRFLKSYELFKLSQNLTNEQIEQLTKEESEAFIEMLKLNKDLDEATFRKQCSKEQLEKFSPLWKFNDSLSEYVKEFRLGYNNIHGAYIRSLINPSSTFYPNTNKVNGVYIDYQTANQYKQSLDELFNNIINKVFPIDNPDKTDYYITTKLGELEGWFSKNSPKPLIINFKDGDDSTQVSVRLDDHTRLASFAFLIILVGNYMHQYSYYPSLFIDYRVNGDLPDRYYIKLDNINEGKPLDWMSAVSIFNDITEFNNSISYLKRKYVVPIDSKNEIGEKDCRVEDMFDLMFHGLISTNIPNDFTRKEIRADYAYFKYGFFSDPIVRQKSSLKEEQEFDETITNLKLFACDAASGGGYMKIKLTPIDQSSKQKSNKSNKLSNKSNTQINTIEKELRNNLDNVLKQIGKPNAIRKKNTLSIEKFFEEVLKEITESFKNGIKMNSMLINIENWENIIEKIDRESDDSSTIIFTKFSDREEFKGKKLVKAENYQNYKILTFDNGDKYRITILGEDVVINKDKPELDISEFNTKDGLVRKIEEIHKSYKNQIDDEDTGIDWDDVMEIINTYYKRNTNLSKDTFDIMINKIQQLFKDSDVINKDKIINELGDLKSSNCSI